MSFNWESESNVMVVRICMAIPFQLLIAIIYYEPQSDIRVKTFSGRNSPEFYMINFKSRVRLNALFEDPVEKLWLFVFVMGFIFFLRASRYITSFNRESETNVMAVRICVVSHFYFRWP